MLLDLFVVQKLFVIFIFSERHVEQVVKLIRFVLTFNIAGSAVISYIVVLKRQNRLKVGTDKREQKVKMQSVSDDDVRKILLEKPRFELAAKGVFRLGRCYILRQGVPGLWACVCYDDVGPFCNFKYIFIYNISHQHARRQPPIIVHVTYDLATDRCQHEYLLTYSFALKSAFDGHHIFCRLWLNNACYSKIIRRTEQEIPIVGT